MREYFEMCLSIVSDVFNKNIDLYNLPRIISVHYFMIPNWYEKHTSMFNEAKTIKTIGKEILNQSQ